MRGEVAVVAVEISLETSQFQAEHAKRYLMKSTYRPDIDGLRALAILPVLLFHADFRFFSGGFIGVDVFFVISGFLITRILVSDLEAKNFSLLRFYERRARRILPALFAVLIATNLAAYYIQLPSEFLALSESTIATLLFASNIYFWTTASDYFHVASETFPLLHTWTLAIEEQFYVVFPLLLALIFPMGRKLTFLLIAAVTVTSLLLNLLLTPSYSSTSFYSTPTRAWELGIGCLLALSSSRYVPTRATRECIALAGLLAILSAVVLYDTTTEFPGYAALLPTLGTAAIILAGNGGNPLVTRLLSIRLLVFLGLISYSLYLFHWPIFALVRLLRGNVELSFTDATFAIAVSVLLASASWRYVETPFRQPQHTVLSRNTIFRGSALIAVVIAGLAALNIHAKGLPRRVPQPLQMADTSRSDINPHRSQCFNLWPSDGLCAFPQDSVQTSADYLVWGDSHADALFPAIETVAHDLGLRGFFAGLIGCPPLQSVVRADASPLLRCDEFNEDVASFLRSRDDVKVVILVARWAVYAEGYRIRGEPGGPVLLAFSGDTASEPDENFAVFSASLRATVSLILESGREVILVGGVPEIGWNVPDALIQHLKNGTPLPPAPSIQDVTERQLRANALLQVLAESPKVEYVSLLGAMCQPVCQTHDKNWRGYYSDGDHMTTRGAALFVAPLIEEALRNLSAR